MKRSRFQGVATIVRFNWHFFVIAAVGVALLLAAACFLPPLPSALAGFSAAATALAVLVSLAASYIAYDASGLYDLAWLAPWMPAAGAAANLHAGFDETSVPLRSAHPALRWDILDFYDPAKHTEVSIRRARAAHPPQPGTLSVRTAALPLPDASLDRALLLLAAHEIRDHAERVAFFRELRRTLRADGLVIVTEHLRDRENLLAYNLGAWHFHTPAEWLATFAEAGLVIVTRQKLNPFITLFVLRPA
ncbi:MAG: hypothetical protein RIQ79_2638 [Verrucomicrobiota bacterium]